MADSSKRKTMGGGTGFLSALKRRLDDFRNAKNMEGMTGRRTFRPKYRQAIEQERFAPGNNPSLASGKKSMRGLRSADEAAGSRGPLDKTYFEAARRGETSQSAPERFSRTGRPKGSLRRGRGYPIP